MTDLSSALLRPANSPDPRPPQNRQFRPGVFVNARLLRLIIGVVMVAVAGWYIYLYLFNKVSLAGVVNAPVITIVSQIDGRIAALPPAQGAQAGAGETLTSVVNERIDTRTASELARALETARTRVIALRAGIDELSALRADLATRASNFRDASVERLEHMVRETRASLKGAQAARHQAEDERQRGETLVQRGFFPTARFDDLTYAAERARAEVARLEAALARSLRELAAAKAGIFLGDNFADVPYSRQRGDEIDMRLSALRSEEQAQIANVMELEGKLSAETERLAKLARQDLLSPVDGVIWRTMVASGTEVLRGSPLFEVIDCSAIYVEATTRERFFEGLAPGQAVRIRLEGSERDVKGRIRSLIGPGASLDAGPKLALLHRRNGTEAQALIDFEPGALPPARGATCHIGRSATVYFD